MSASFAYSAEVSTSFFDQSAQDKRFYQVLVILLSLYIIGGIIIPMLKVNSLEPIKIETIKPTITKIRLEKEVPKPKVEPEKTVKPKAPPKPKPVEKPKAQKPKIQKPKEIKPPAPSPEALRAAARQKAANTGLAALNQDIASLRGLSNSAPKAQASKVIAASSGSASTSISDRLYSSAPTQGQANLQGNKTAANIDARLAGVSTSSISGNGTKNDAALSDGGGISSNGKSVAGQRDEASVRRIFDRSKSSASALYNRALRKNPLLSGKVTFQVTIAPSGLVTSAKIVTSQLADAALERKLLLKVKSLNFGAQAVSSLTLKYTYDFVPG